MGFELGAFSYYVSFTCGAIFSIVVIAMIIEMLVRHAWSIIDDGDYTSSNWVGDHTLAKLFELKLSPVAVFCSYMYIWLSMLAILMLDDGGQACLAFFDLLIAIVFGITSLLVICRALRRQGKMFKKQQ